MDLLLKAIRTRLIEDLELTSIVPADDITASYVAERASYPCVVLSVRSGGSVNITGADSAKLEISIYSRTNKKQLWTIYSRIKFLLHNNEQKISDAERSIHSIYETDVRDDHYDEESGAWALSAIYTVLYSTPGLLVTTNANGAIYADPILVTADPAKEVAKFRGNVNLRMSYNAQMRSSQGRFGQAVFFNEGSARLIIGEVMFKPSVLNLLWNVTRNESGWMNDGVTSATVFQISRISTPAYLHVLFQMTKTDDGKKMELQAERAVCPALSFEFAKKDFSIFDCEWILLADDSGNVLKIAVEN